MENNEDPEMDDFKFELPKLGEVIEQRLNQSIKSPDLKKIFSDLNLDPNLSDLFYDSLKSMFDEGLKLANSINLDFLLDKGKVVKKKKEE